MVVRYIKNVIRTIFYPFVFLKYKNIWNLKKYLKDNNIQSGLLASVYDLYFFKRGSYIGINAEFGNTPYFPHGPLGVFISDMSVIGKNAVIFQQVTIGANRTIGSKNQGNPTIGDNVYIGAGAKIIGNIKIGDNCRIGANAVVYENIPDNSVAVTQRTRIIKKNKKNDNRFCDMDANGVLKYYKDGKFVVFEE